jgi:hypothetical protein
MEGGGRMIKKSELILATLCGFFFGVVIGFLISPIKKGIEIGNDSGNNCGNTTKLYYDEEEDK